MPPDPQRRARGYVLARKPDRMVERIEKTTPDGKAVVTFRVPSGRLYDVFYDVYFLDAHWICSGCPDFSERFQPCKHIHEVVDRFYPELAPAPPEERLLTAFNAGGNHYRGIYRAPHVPFVYADGPAESTLNDQALRIEDARVLEQLAEMGPVIDRAFPRIIRAGHPSLSPGQRVLAMVMRSQHEKSMLKFHAESNRLATGGVLPFGPKKSTFVRYNASLDTLAYLAEAYRLAVAPYTDLERILLVDATGFSSRLVSNWLDHSTAEHEKRAVTDYRDETMWLKFHAIVGRISHAVLGFRLTPPSGPMSADATLFPYLLDDVVGVGFAPQFVGCDNIYLTTANWEACRKHDSYLVCPEKGRNRSKKTGEPIGAGKQMAELRKMYPETVEDIKRARQAIEGVFSVEKRNDNHLAAAGTKAERQAFRNALAGNAEIASVINDVEYGLYVSRMVEIYVRALRQVLRRTVNMELRWKCQISYQHGTKFPVLRG